MYESDTTRFLRELLKKNPQLAELQRRNRSTWWDRPQDLETQKEHDEADVPPTSYAYFPRPK